MRFLKGPYHGSGSTIYWCSKVPSRRTLTRDIELAYTKAKQDLISLLAAQRTVATTADSWRAHRRSFLGMTVHWIDGESLERRYATLACRELQVENSLGSSPFQQTIKYPF